MPQSPACFVQAGSCSGRKWYTTVDSRTSGKLALWEESKEKQETATWKGRILSSWAFCQNFLKATSRHISHIHIPGDTWEWLQSLSFSYLLSISPRTAVLSSLVSTPCKLHLAWTVLLNTRASLEVFLISKRQRDNLFLERGGIYHMTLAPKEFWRVWSPVSVQPLQDNSLWHQDLILIFVLSPSLPV